GAEERLARPGSAPGRDLAIPRRSPLQARRPVAPDPPRLRVGAPRLHDLRQVDARIPVGRLSVVTGVSGSGKSTLAREVMLDNLAQAVSIRGTPSWSGCSRITGWEVLDRVLEVDQTPIGKTPRSCPATYVGFWDDVRKLFAGT